MEYPRKIMKMSELKGLGFPQPLLMEAYRDPKRYKGGSIKTKFNNNL